MVRRRVRNAHCRKNIVVNIFGGAYNVKTPKWPVIHVASGSTCTHSLEALVLALTEFQAWDWLWYPVTCSPRCGVGMRMEHKPRPKSLPWLGFEPRTSHLAVLHTTPRSLCTPHCWIQFTISIHFLVVVINCSGVALDLKITSSVAHGFRQVGQHCFMRLTTSFCRFLCHFKMASL